MGDFEHVTQLLALSLGVAWASGINLYAAVFTLGLFGATGNMSLPPGLEALSHPVVIGAAGLMYAIEFFADKIPGVDSAWDVVHTFIRIPAGAILAAEALGDVDPALSIAAGLVGGVVAGSMHITKAGTRLLINTSPEPFSNSLASLTEDAAVFGGLWMMTQHPVWFLVMFVAGMAVVAWAVPKLWRGIRMLAGRIASFLRGRGLSATATAGGPFASMPLPTASRIPDGEDQRPTV
ncbi:MAG: DUF4126 domain-containing protein [Candidatus Binatia bacterium]